MNQLIASKTGIESVPSVVEFYKDKLIEFTGLMGIKLNLVSSKN